MGNKSGRTTTQPISTSASSNTSSLYRTSLPTSSGDGAINRTNLSVSSSTQSARYQTSSSATGGDRTSSRTYPHPASATPSSYWTSSTTSRANLASSRTNQNVTSSTTSTTSVTSSAVRPTYSSTSPSSFLCVQGCGRVAVHANGFCNECYISFIQLMVSSSAESSSDTAHSSDRHTNHETYIRHHISKYRNKDLTSSAILRTLKAFPDLRPKFDHFTYSAQRDLLSIVGTIPVEFRGATYNIPICIWLFESYPFNSPTCHVTPSESMMIKPSRHVDASGRVYLPYLNEWNYPNSDLIGLIKDMAKVFSENCPVFARPANQQMTTSHPGAQTQPPQPQQPAFHATGAPNNGRTSSSTTSTRTTNASRNSYSGPNSGVSSSTKTKRNSYSSPSSSTMSPPPPTSSGGARPKDQDTNRKVEGIRDNLLCPIHLDLVERAKTLPCQHFMCEDCLAKWVASRGDLKCPTCNTEHVLPIGGVAKLPDNFVINNLVAEMKKLDEEQAEKGEDERKVEDQKNETTTNSTSNEHPQITARPSTNLYHSQTASIAATSILTKMGNKNFGVKGLPVKLTLKLCDEDGAPVRGSQSDSVTGVVQTPQGEDIAVTDITLKKRHGDYWLSFTPDKMGVHQLLVFVNGEVVQGCPMKVVIRPCTQVCLQLHPKLCEPKGVFSRGSDIFVTDGVNATYRRIDRSGVLIDCSELPYCPSEELPSLFSIADLGGKLLVTDNNNSCVYVYDGGAYKSHFGSGVLESPTGIIVNQGGTIYVADSKRNTIDIFRPNHTHSGTITIPGRQNQCSLAMLALNQAQDRIIVADERDNAVKIFALQSSRMVKSIKTRIQQAPARPFGVAVDQEGNLYVSVTYDPNQKKADNLYRNGIRQGAIIAYNPNGYFLGTIGENELTNPRGICFVSTPSPQLIVVDDCGSNGNSSIKVFSV